MGYRKGQALLWGSIIGLLTLLGLWLVIIGVPHYDPEDDLRLTDVNDHASFHYPVPIPGDKTFCVGNVTVMTGEPVALEDGMTYTLFASGNGKCAYTTTVRVLHWRGVFS